MHLEFVKSSVVLSHLSLLVWLLKNPFELQTFGFEQIMIRHIFWWRMH